MTHGALTTINTKTIVAKAALILVLSLLLPCVYFTAQGQTEQTFTPETKFESPNFNSTIRFAARGTYEQATLENGTWNFVHLHLANSQQPEKLNLTITVQDSNVTILSYQRFNSTLWGSRLTYTVVGKGKQTFNFDLGSRGEWSVTFNRVYANENDGWRLSPDQTITVTGATRNATLTYYVYPDDFGGNGGNPNQSLYRQHSVSITVGIVLAIGVLVALVIMRRAKATRTETH